MRAIAYQHGDISVLEEVLLPKPKVKDQHLLVRVRAFGLNPLDYQLRRGELKVITGMRGTKLIGSDFAGVVESVGPNVHGFSVGMLSLNDFSAIGRLLRSMDCSAREAGCANALLTFRSGGCRA